MKGFQMVSLQVSNWTKAKLSWHTDIKRDKQINGCKTITSFGGVNERQTNYEPGEIHSIGNIYKCMTRLVIAQMSNEAKW